MVVFMSTLRRDVCICQEGLLRAGIAIFDQAAAHVVRVGLSTVEDKRPQSRIIMGTQASFPCSGRPNRATEAEEISLPSCSCLVCPGN